MLIRICGHFINNSQHIDKLICIRGLPEDWMFRKRLDGQRELAPPFTPDIDENIPKSIRHLCTPTEIVKYFPPIEKGREGVIDKLTILGVRLDYMTEAGRAMWIRIQRYMDDSLPRHTKVPEPVLVARDQKSPFETYLPHKQITGGVQLEPCEIPVVDLDAEQAALILPPARSSPPVVETPKPVAISFKCEHEGCGFTHPKKQGVVMHRMKRHPKIKEKAVATP